MSDYQKYIDAIPEEDRGHVWHELGKELGKHGGAHTNDDPTPPGTGDGSGNTPPPPPPPGH